MHWLVDGLVIDTTREIELFKAAGDGHFILLRHWYRGQIVIRFGPSSEHYDLRFWTGSPHAGQHFVLKDDPTANSVVAAYNAGDDEKTLLTTVDGRLVPVWDLRTEVQLKPQPKLRGANNPTKHTPSFMEPIAYGSVRVLDSNPDFYKLQFEGKGFKGLFALRREDPQSEFWSFERSAGPSLEKVVQSLQQVLAKGPAEHRVRLLKMDKMKQIVWGVVMEPDVTDAQGHFATIEEIGEALHYFMLNWQLMDEEHQRVIPRSQAAPVEAMQMPIDVEWPVDDSGNVEHIRKGSWVQATQIFDSKLWQKYLDGDMNAYSIRGWGKLRDGQQE